MKFTKNLPDWYSTKGVETVSELSEETEIAWLKEKKNGVNFTMVI